MAEHPTGDRIRRDASPGGPRRKSGPLRRLEALRPKARKLALRLGLQRPRVCFDLETTGLDTSKDRIVEIATLKLFPGGDTDLRGGRVNPGMPIPPEATEVHKITDELVAACPTFAEIAPKVAAFMDGCDLAGYNVARFDVPLLEAEFRRVGEEFSIEDRRIVDVMRIYHDREPRDLTAAVRYYCGGNIEDAHSALADTLSTLEILAEQLDRYRDLPADIDELDRISRPPAWFDRDGRLVWRDGELCFGFGKHRGRFLSEVAEEAPGYLEWILRDDFSLKVKDAITMAKAGSPPRQLATPANEPGRDNAQSTRPTDGARTPTRRRHGGTTPMPVSVIAMIAPPAGKRDSDADRPRHRATDHGRKSDNTQLLNLAQYASLKEA